MSHHNLSRAREDDTSDIPSAGPLKHVVKPDDVVRQNSAQEIGILVRRSRQMHNNVDSLHGVIDLCRVRDVTCGRNT